MASTLSQFKGVAAAIGTASTRFVPIASGGSFSGGGIVSATEANAQRTARAAGIYSRMAIRLSANASDGNTVFTFRKGGANGNQTVTFAAAETGVKQDLTNADAVVSGDTINIQGVNAGTGSATINGSCFAFKASSNTVQAYTFNFSSSINNAATTTYYAISGDNSTAVQADREYKVGTVGTFKNMGVRVSANTIDVTGSATYAFLKNGAAGNGSIVFASGETGLKEDLVNTDAVAVNDLVCIRQTNTGVTGSNATGIAWISLETTNNKTDYISVANSTRIVAQTRFFDFIGTSSAASVETNVPIVANVAATLSNARAYVSANTWSANFTVTLRKNLANAAPNIVFATTVTGWVHDAVNTESVVASDALDWQMTTSAGAGSVTTTNVVITAEMAPEGGSTLLLMGVG